MAGIPRFSAQVTAVSVPKMRDYEYEQNRSIYQTLKKAGERINNTFFDMVAQGEIGKPNQDYETNVKNYETAVANNRPKEEVDALKKKVEETPEYKFNHFVGWGF